MDLQNFSYTLPEDHIAHTPAQRRDHSRLLLLDRHSGDIAHHHFFDLPSLLTPSDILVFNDTRVFPARLFGTKLTGGRVEVLLIKKLNSTDWTALTKPGLKLEQKLNFSPQISAVCIDHNPDQTLTLRFNHLTPSQLNRLGHTPLPPYIHSPLTPTAIKQRYQTAYAKDPGSAAAPTAGLHFTPTLLKKLKDKGISQHFLTLHVGLGTFKPLTQKQLKDGTLHSESFILDPQTASALNAAKKQGKRVIAVGTTTTRVLESCANQNGTLIPQSAETNIFIKPPYKFKFIDGLITNFHLSQSSLLMLVSAFTSSPNTANKFTTFSSSPIGRAYQNAIDNNYRFFSFGDAMFIS